MSVYFDGMRRRKGQNTLCHKRPILVLLWVFFDASLHPLFSLIVHFRSNLPNTQVMIKLLIFTGVRNAELAGMRITDVDLENLRVRIEQGKGKKDRYVLIPASFRGELMQYIESQREKKAIYLFESNRLQPYSTRRIRQIVKQYAESAGIAKRVYPHLFRHQLITYLTKQGIVSPKLQLLSGHSEEKSLAIYRGLALADVMDEYEEAMKAFPIR